MARGGLAFLLAFSVACDGSPAAPPVPDADAVDPPRLLRITVSPVPEALPAPGSTVDLSATGTYDDGTEAALTGLAWSSSDESVGTVDGQGTFTARGGGSTEVSARFEGIEGRTTIRVEEVLGRLQLTAPGDTAYSHGVRLRFGAAVVDEDGRPLTEADGARPIGWRSLDESIATVDDQGLVTPRRNGSVVIVAESGNLRAERELHVDGRIPVTIDPARAEALQWALEDSVASWGYPGGMAAVSFPNGDLWVGATGQSRPDRQMSPDLESYFASVTKTLIAAVVHQLAGEGRLEYGDRIGDFLPTREHIDPEITVEQLLGHTSGLYDYVTDGGGLSLSTLLADPDRVFTPGELLTSFVGPRRQAPGISAEYSNTNFLVLGEIVEQVSGRPFYEEVRRRLVDPFRLDDTYFGAWEEGSRERVTGYLPDGSDGTLIEVPTLESFAGPTGGIVSTVSDMARWSRLLFAGDVVPAAAVGRLRVVEPIHNAGPSGVDVRVLGIGQGAFTTRAGGNVFIGHGGTFPHIHAAIAHSESLDLSVAFAVNQGEVVPAVEARLPSALLNVASSPVGAFAQR